MKKAGPRMTDRPLFIVGSGRSLRCGGLFVLLHAAAARLGLGHNLALDAQRRGEDRGDAGGVIRILHLFTAWTATAARLLGAGRLVLVRGSRMLDSFTFGLEATGRTAIAPVVVTLVALVALIAIAAIITTAAVVATIAIAIVTAGFALLFASRRALVPVLAAGIPLVTSTALTAALTLGAVHLEIVVIAVDIGVGAATLLGLAGILLLEARPGLREDAEIVIGELEVIFGVDAVALHLRVARKILVFLKKLGGVATGAVVDAVAIALVGVATTTLLALATTAAPAAVVRLTIVYQRLCVLSLTQSAIDHQ